ncbi:Uncharacterized protein Fot_09888 [Forsythia ovata]|uniref:Uncharacterized protein n=1 Tax=Forsythia ovata TaxID=205694 RepID=A0ABD1WI07_9LAMI
MVLAIVYDTFSELKEEEKERLHSRKELTSTRMTFREQSAWSHNVKRMKVILKDPRHQWQIQQIMATLQEFIKLNYLKQQIMATLLHLSLLYNILMDITPLHFSSSLTMLRAAAPCRGQAAPNFAFSPLILHFGPQSFEYYDDGCSKWYLG